LSDRMLLAGSTAIVDAVIIDDFHALWPREQR
jgi:hypothetical protein